ncbi:DUF262 domain-containing protein [Clostridium botulinum]|nr:DUF262 domain-containing protein [Clostridium botulinum]
MRTIDWIDNDKKDIKWIVDMFKNELLFVDNSFQRRYVWLEKHQIKLIETMLLGYAVPEVYIWVTDTDAITGDTKYSIIDGQQRIGAVVDFIKGKFKLKKSILDESSSKFANKKFEELDDNDKKLIWRYAFSMRVVKSEVSREDIVKLFLRLNSTDKSLNPQELRNAEFDGKFLKLANEVAGFDFWKKNKIFSINDLRRMKDMEFISSLLIFLRSGVEAEITQAAINKAYDLFNEKYDDYEDDKLILIKILDELQKLIDYDEKNLKVISKVTHLYTFIIVAYSAIIQKNGFDTEDLVKLSEFIKEYDKPNLDSKNIAEIKKYKALSVEGTQGKANRLERVRIISKIVEL